MSNLYISSKNQIFLKLIIFFSMSDLFGYLFCSIFPCTIFLAKNKCNLLMCNCSSIMTEAGWKQSESFSRSNMQRCNGLETLIKLLQASPAWRYGPIGAEYLCFWPIRARVIYLEYAASFCWCDCCILCYKSFYRIIHVNGIWTETNVLWSMIHDWTVIK